MEKGSQITQLLRGARDLKLALSESQVELFDTYLQEILAWNRRHNIVSRADQGRIASYHFVDSLSVIDLLPKKNNLRCLDLGSGAGFPGIPIKIIRPDICLALVEPKRWRYLFLERVAETLKLENTTVLRIRAEDCADQYGKHDVVFARSVAKLSDLVSLALPLLAQGGILIAFKSEEASDEMNQAGKALDLHGARVAGTKKLILPLTGITRVFVLIGHT
jgi:16S rRNA (guanine527-N7)-methyltransferase